jgi:hypothetical protein
MFSIKPSILLVAGAFKNTLPCYHKPTNSPFCYPLPLPKCKLLSFFKSHYPISVLSQILAKSFPNTMIHSIIVLLGGKPKYYVDLITGMGV